MKDFPSFSPYMGMRLCYKLNTIVYHWNNVTLGRTIFSLKTEAWARVIVSSSLRKNLVHMESF